ncbi:MAG: hypothetical protein GXP49_17105 [Deltaproteobacteria bacterium]|nr:hypothetical protein [Deltaproteobacteria bacterium]
MEERYYSIIGQIRAMPGTIKAGRDSKTRKGGKPGRDEAALLFGASRWNIPDT